MAETYTPQGKVASITYYGSGSPATSDYFDYTYDAAGQEVSEISDNGGTVDNTYNGSGELTSSGAASYPWDLVGNPTGTGYTVNADNELTTTPTDSLTYNGAGQLVKDTTTATNNTWFYTYTGAGLLATAAEYSASSGGTLEESVAYEYDAFGNRVQESVTAGGVTTVTQFAYDGWNPAKAGAVGTSGFDVYAQYTVGPYNLVGLPQQTTQYLDGDMVDQVFGRIDSTLGPAWLEQDKNMSVCDITDGNGDLRDTIQYGAFGNVTAQTQYNGLGGSTPETPQTDTWTGLFTFAGMQRDPATGLYYDNARYYSPSLQRFISPDPLGLSGGGTNLYVYTGNAPTDASDPSGMLKTYIIPQNTELAAGIGFSAPRTGREVQVGLMQPSSPLNGNDNAGNNWNGKKIITEYKYGNTWVSTMAINPGSLRTPGGGLLSVYPSGPFDYQPLPSFHGVDKFAYRGANGVGVNGLNWEDVNIEVGAQPPGCGCGDTNRVSYSSGLPVNWPPAGSETSAALSLTLFLVDNPFGRGEEPGALTSITPVLGSANNASYNYAQGNYGTYVFYCIMTGTDVILVRSLATSGARLIGSALPAAAARGGAAPGAITLMESGDAFLANASRAVPDGMLDVIAHGSPTSVQYGNRGRITHRALCRLIQQNPQFTGQPIRLISCNTGQLPRGFAQGLSTRLGVQVHAPDNLIHAWPNGTFTIGTTETAGDGMWRVFFPGVH